MASVEYLNATCVYPGATSPAVDELNLSIDDGEFMVLVGPSGSGKSTALRMLAGLEKVTSGHIQIDGNDVSRNAPKERNIAMVFQNYALYPHMTVGENMAFALKLRGVPKPEREVAVRRAAELLDLVPYLERKPKALSGGQRQRVAMGRAIVRDPAVFLMDEPLSNLDAQLRVETRANIAEIQARLKTTTVYVTHDQVEAMTMGHRIAVLKDGLLQQVDTPRQLYEKPVNAFVAGFIGSPAMNLCDVDVVPGGVWLGNTILRLSPAMSAAIEAAGLTRATVGLRPEAFKTAGQSAEPAGAGLAVTVKLVEELGADSYVYATIDGAGEHAKPIVVRHDHWVPPKVGERITLDLLPRIEHVFDPGTGARLGDAA